MTLQEYADAIRKGDDPLAVLRVAVSEAESSALERAAKECKLRIAMWDRLKDQPTVSARIDEAEALAEIIGFLKEPAAESAAEPVGYCMASDHSVSPHPKDEDCVDWEAEPSPPSGYVPGITHEAEDRHTPTWEQFKTAHPAALAAETGKVQGAEARDAEWIEALRLYGVYLDGGRIWQNPPSGHSYDLKLKRLLNAARAAPPEREGK